MIFKITKKIYILFLYLFKKKIRLISEKTVEENILKKARQKRFLSDLAIDGGNFTTAFLKNDSIKELFNIDTNATSTFNELNNNNNNNAQNLLLSESQEITNNNNTSSNVLIEEIEDEKSIKYKSQLGHALNTAEEDDDVKACKIATAEASAEFAEFDESIPLDVDRAEEKSPEEEELERIVQQVNYLKSNFYFF